MANPKHGYTDDDLDQLTDEEREGLLDEDLVDDVPLDPEADADPDKPADPAAPPAKPEPEKPAPAASPPGDVAQPPSAFPRFEAPADAANRIDAIEAQKDELATKFDEGELTATELRAKMKPLEAEERALRESLLKASLSAGAETAQWRDATVPAFLSANAIYKDNELLFNALDSEVRKLQSAALADGKSQYDAAILKAAHDKVTAALRKSGLTIPEPRRDPAPPKRDLPPSLAHVPAADPTDVDENEFSALDRLADIDPLKYEAALAKMSDAERERYLAN